MANNVHGEFTWYELVTSDLAAAEDFYGKVVGWNFADSGMPDTEYHFFTAGDAGIGGMMALTDEMKSGGASPFWMGYVEVDDVDASAEAIAKAGGMVHMAPWDLPNVGRMSLIAGPDGAMIYIMKGEQPSDSPAFSKYEKKDGHCAWNELMCDDPEAASAFYGEQFDWKHEKASDMGEMGTYHEIKHGDYMIAGMMQKPAEAPMPMWNYYFRVADIDKAVETITAEGGQVMMGPMEIPGGDFSVNAVDPQGAPFALVGART
ncbi:VOC family protein [Alterisphingorhabdus coralli]|uniref:VOC family protein n=1 Tax=Alterisphingorhabdus coralli TaxID=3071408 RepID=A0AA97I0N6_9SPHN|nr:VOC family protein [Parasphingorhabdus sp. SCSIO 66989]WOE75874.1 VOC family protein [Parasphingorhabdus sp. SCSIO 66989]